MVQNQFGYKFLALFFLANRLKKINRLKTSIKPV